MLVNGIDTPNKMVRQNFDGCSGDLFKFLAKSSHFLQN